MQLTPLANLCIERANYYTQATGRFAMEHGGRRIIRAVALLTENPECQRYTTFHLFCGTRLAQQRTQRINPRWVFAYPPPPVKSPQQVRLLNPSLSHGEVKTHFGDISR